MVASIRQQIIEAVDLRLKTILERNGYSADLGVTVLEWPLRDIDPSEMPCLTYYDRTSEQTPFTNRRAAATINIEIEAYVQEASATPAALRRVIADIYTAIGTDDRWSDLAQDTISQGEEIEIGQGEKITGRATVRIAIEYEKEKWGF